MKKRVFTRVAALLVCAVLAFSACGAMEAFDFRDFLENQGYENQVVHSRERRTILFDDMVYARPDADQVKAEVRLQTANIQTAESYDAVLAAIEASNVAVENFYTMYTLAEINSYRFVTDSYYEEEYRWISEVSVEVGVLSNELNRAILQGPYAAQYRDEVGDYYYEYLENSLLLDSPEVEGFKKQRNQLTADYKALLTSSTIEYDGAQYTLNQLAEMGGDVFAFYDQMVPQFAELYGKLIELDKQTAQALGFGSPAEMYYLSYSRDYTPADAVTLYDNLKRVFIPVVYEALDLEVSVPGVSMNEALTRMPGALGKVDEELVEAFNFMVGNNLYDIQAREGKHQGIAFTADIMGYDAPFIYQYWDESSFSSTATLMHEFGHFYDNWMRYDLGAVFNLDIAETYSQGLELLLHPYYGDFISEADAANARLDSLADFAVNSVIYQSILEEFQIRAYALDSYDSATLGKLFNDVMGGYGLGGRTDENGAINYWFEITHLFDAPFYTISYVTSALAALQIWEQSRTDHNQAVLTYMKLIHADQNQPFGQLLEYAGLDSVHQRSTMQRIADEMLETFEDAGKQVPENAPSWMTDDSGSMPEALPDELDGEQEAA